MNSRPLGYLLGVAALLLACAQAGFAAEARPVAEDPVLEARTMALAAELRCLVCQNQSLADSNAGLALDLRNQIREQLRQGASEAQIVEFLVARYGDFVLYRPPFKAATALLWLGPLAFVLAGLAAVFVLLRRRRAAPEVQVSEAERERARSLLDQGGGAA